MTPQEQEMIGDLIDRVQKTQLPEKDMDAEQMLQQGIGKNPDALYILSQTVLVQKYALEQAQAQLTQARAQMQQEPKHATSFLGSLLGRSDAAAPPPPPPRTYPPQPVQAYPQYAPVSGAPQYGAPMGMGGGGGFLQGALQTAAGVAAGALAFEGVESLMHGFGHSAGYGGQGFGGFDGGQRPVEEVVNNYYGDDRGDRGGREASSTERADDDRESRDFAGNDDRASLYGSNDNDGPNIENASFDDSDSNLDDSGSDFGGDDSGGGGDDGNFA